jgi:hypothetical protein
LSAGVNTSGYRATEVQGEFLMSSLYAALFALLTSLGMDPTAACPESEAPTMCLPPPPPAPPPTPPRTLTNDIYNGF